MLGSMQIPDFLCKTVINSVQEGKAGGNTQVTHAKLARLGQCSAIDQTARNSYGTCATLLGSAGLPAKAHRCTSYVHLLTACNKVYQWKSRNIEMKMAVAKKLGTTTGAAVAANAGAAAGRGLPGRHIRVERCLLRRAADPQGRSPTAIL